MSLFHYTDVRAVQSILKTQTLRLTDIRFLNDSKELHDGLSVIEECIRENNFEHQKYIEEAIIAIKYSLLNLDGTGMELSPLYVFSLSSTKDQLSQWRSYGSYAIEFDRDILFNDNNYLTECTYRAKEKYEKAKEHVAKTVATIAEEMNKYNGALGPVGFDAMIALVHDAATFKHEGFQEERESRILMSSNEERDVKYRERGNILIPYIELKISLDSIKSIQIGPIENQNLAYTSMSEFVRQVERDWQIEIGNIEYELSVENSPIPYRE